MMDENTSKLGHKLPNITAAPDRKSTMKGTAISRQSNQTISQESSFENGVLPSHLISNQNFRKLDAEFQLSDHVQQKNNQKEIDSCTNQDQSHTNSILNQANLSMQKINNFCDEDDYIPGGFANLDKKLEEHLLNEFADELDNTALQPHQHIPSTRASDNVTDASRSPIELWQRARILIALHLLKNETSDQSDSGLLPSTTNDSHLRKSHDDIMHAKDKKELSILEKLYEKQTGLQDQKTMFGLSILKKLSLDPSQQYQYVDFYNVGFGYVFMCNVVDNERPELSIKDYSNLGQRHLHRKVNPNPCQMKKFVQIQTLNSSVTKPRKLLVYPVDIKSTDKVESVELDCPFEFNFMICIPVFRLILGFIVSATEQRSLMIIVGDASRKSVFLSKQEILHCVSSILYLHESKKLFIGSMGRVLLYNTQPLQFTSNPMFVCELAHLPFQPVESIIYLTRMTSHQTIGILSSRYFVLWQHAPNETLLSTLCNPYRYNFNRCLYNAKFNYIIFAFIDGLISIYEINEMKQIRRYRNHWQEVTDLKNIRDETLLLSSSIDHTINVWNLDTLQHIYQYNASEEIFQIDILHENFLYYRSLRNIVLFQLNLHTMVFSLVKRPLKSLKLVTDIHRTERIVALSENDSSIIISPVSGCCLTYVPNISKQPIKQILHDISRSHVYSLQFNGEIIVYRADNNPCVAEYKIHTRSQKYIVTCMTLVNMMDTQIASTNTFDTSIGKILEKQAIFFGHTNGYISLFQGGSLIMKPVLAHENAIVCLETSRISSEKSDIFFTYNEILLSSSTDGVINLWNLTLDESDESIQLILILTVKQEKNVSLKSIKLLGMFDNFIVANYCDQKYLHIWQLINISIQTNVPMQWSVVEHATKGNHHGQLLQALSATTRLKLFASSDTEGTLKIWDHTNSLIRQIHFDESLCAIEFLVHENELLIAYQDNIHLVLPENYLMNHKKQKAKKQNYVNRIAEDNFLEITQPLSNLYECLPLFNYRIQAHHRKKRLHAFERRLAGRFTVNKSDSSESDDGNRSISTSDHLSTISDDPNWSELAEDVKDILRMKKYQMIIQSKK